LLLLQDRDAIMYATKRRRRNVKSYATYIRSVYFDSLFSSKWERNYSAKILF